MEQFPDCGMVWVVNPYFFNDWIRDEAWGNMISLRPLDNLAFYNALMEHVIL